MDKLPQRDDLIYKEIEEFQDYELTNCIAYEMALRNENINKLVNKYLKKRIVISYLEEKNDEIKLLRNYGFSLETMLMTEILNILKKDFKLFSGLINRMGTYPSDILINKKYKNLSIYFEKGNFILESYDNKNIIVEEIDKKNINKDFISSLRFNFRRPKLQFEKNKIVKIELNLNLPKEELIVYISKIKDEYDKDNSIIKTPLELLGETLEKSDNKKTPKKPKASVYADWFYIYDYWKYEKTQGRTDKDIFVALEVEKNILYGEENIRKIRDKMRYFIDNLGYKELITGVKNS
ncbi:MAG: hypothetical protein RBR70_11485 [Arcobacter sp.]|jgi:hypothetical protein|uniref:hypothetical protein n=1 Tax=Arcobacter sp. TaxID=1872629 RepID=UPI002588E67F|nr:hypothetical protein [Arcobacter sp.]MDD3007963.1 hypothetical protein [Arcobacter sp.]MDY3205683.1 hypothetical protein [Arcobacter sp.]